MKWFKHDSDAHRDARMKKLVMTYGMEGYGLYWHCLEEIAHGVSQEKYTFELEHDASIIAFDTGISQKKVEEMMSFMVDIGLFENTEGTITCLKLGKRLDQSMTSNPAMRRIINKVKENHDSIMTPSRLSHDPIMTESGNRQTRLDKTRLEKKNTRGRFTPPSEGEVRNYVKEKSYRHVDPDEFCGFYGSKDWMVGKNKMKDWKKAVQGWEARHKKNGGSSTADNIFAI